MSLLSLTCQRLGSLSLRRLAQPQGQVSAAAADFSSKHQASSDVGISPIIPKKPLTAYALFTADHFGQRQKENPNVSVPQVMVKLAKEWNASPDQAKTVYKDMAKSKLVEYQKQMDEFKLSVAKDPELAKKVAAFKNQEKVKKVDRELRKVNRELAELGIKTKPPSAWGLFYKANYKTIGGKGVLSDKAAHVASLWKGMDEKARKPYVDKADQLKAEYSAKAQPHQQLLDMRDQILAKKKSLTAAASADK